MRYRAVIFDLFGSLIYNLNETHYERVLHEMAAVLGVPATDFIEAWRHDFVERMMGCFGDEEGNIRHACEITGIQADDDAVTAAYRIRGCAFAASSFTPVNGAVETLAELRRRGLSLGLISDCSADTPALWQKTPLAEHIDVAIFSCKVGMKKPDPRIYLLACERLGVEPTDCLYVGDGSSDELAGAQRVGMDAILIRDGTGTEPMMAPRIQPSEWNGRMINSPCEILEFMK